MPNPESAVLVKLKRQMVTMGDGKCYFSYCECRSFNGKIILLTIVEIHCREYGNVEGGYEYNSMVSYSL